MPRVNENNREGVLSTLDYSRNHLFFHPLLRLVPSRSKHLLPLISCQCSHSHVRLPTHFTACLLLLSAQHWRIRIWTWQLSALTPDHSPVPTSSQPSSIKESNTIAHGPTLSLVPSNLPSNKVSRKRPEQKAKSCLYRDHIHLLSKFLATPQVTRNYPSTIQTWGEVNLQINHVC